MNKSKYKKDEKGSFIDKKTRRGIQQRIMNCVDVVEI
jgi:hypothetical protein